MHARQAIREACKTILVSANTAAGSRVYETRLTPWEAVKLPAIAVYALEETIDQDQSRETAPRQLWRNLTLEIVGAVRAGDNVDDALDDMAASIEAAMNADRWISGTVGDSLLDSTNIAIEVTGDKPIGFVVLNYAVTYFTESPTEATQVVSPLEGFDIQTSLEDAQAEADRAKDTINL